MRHIIIKKTMNGYHVTAYREAGRSEEYVFTAASDMVEWLAGELRA